MIYIYGDSHGNFSFNNLALPHKKRHCNSITMFRIGRDNTIINFNKNEVYPGDTILLVYGEVDCRCHIERQKHLGKNEDIIINELVHKYFQTLKNNIPPQLTTIIVGVIPPTKCPEHADAADPATQSNNEFPIIGTDENRVRYTSKVNKLLEELSIANNYFYFYPYEYYTSREGTLIPELSDSTVHIGDNSIVLEKFMDFYNKINHNALTSSTRKRINMCFT
jgi:hypothetical protein